MACLRCACLVVAAACVAELIGADWNQWRGPGRNGAASEEQIRLISALPAGGLPPLWLSEKGIPGGGDGGWSSPIVAAGKVYLFAHFRTPGVRLPAPRYPQLKEEDQAKFSAEDLAEYEKLRTEEEQRRRRQQPYDEVIYCFDAQTGKTLWKNSRKSVHTGVPHSTTPAVVGEKLYVLAAGLNARCVNARTGEDLWQTRLPGSFDYEAVDSSFAIAENVAVVLAGHLIGLDATTGKLVWQGDKQKQRGRHSSPVVWRAAGREWIIANVAGGETICVDPQSGAETWRVKSEAENSTPVVVGDRLITFGNSRKKGLRCFALSVGSAQHQWTWQGAADPGSSPVVVGTCVYAQGEQRLGCVDLESGKEAWLEQLDLPNPRYTSLVAADGKVLYTYDGLLMLAANPAKFEPLIRAKIDSAGTLRDRADTEAKGSLAPLECASPAIADGRLYMRLRDAVACYNLKADD